MGACAALAGALVSVPLDRQAGGEQQLLEPRLRTTQLSCVILHAGRVSWQLVVQTAKEDDCRGDSMARPLLLLCDGFSWVALHSQSSTRDLMLK